MKGMTTCKVCGRDFPLISEEHYTARNLDKEGGQIGLVIAGKEEPAIFDAFDCPHCGCQNVMQERKRSVDSEPEVDNSETWSDGTCCMCKYSDRDADEYPCNECSHNFVSGFEKEEEENG